eukprot:TRINITY_DN47699_c0_g1_i1.p1 TRINITY_DN47699_c0_g1~~TRINITY_DN47699_c0_g1_i1.p1  ORF type:complete len:489 (+),score=137.33 TRINITY_DN47699_c0_g1_i1:116-1582(+)
MANSPLLPTVDAPEGDATEAAAADAGATAAAEEGDAELTDVEDAAAAVADAAAAVDGLKELAALHSTEAMLETEAGFDTELAGTGGAAASSTRKCPKLLVGSKLDKECPLRPDRWVRIGRSQHCEIWLDSDGVSREHCRVRWDTHRRLIEFADASPAGTLVNGKPVKGKRRTLVHGDRICIRAKSAEHEMLLDLRPVNLGLTDPRQLVSDAMTALKAAVRRRERLKAQLGATTCHLTQQETELRNKEKEYYDLLAKRKLRQVAIDKMRADTERLQREQQDLTKLLETSREEWANRQQAMIESNAQDVKPMTEKVALYQDMLEKIKMKKSELERTINPSAYKMLVGGSGSSDGDILGLRPPSSSSQQGGSSAAGGSRPPSAHPTPSPAKSPAKQGSRPASQHGDESGEEQAAFEEAARAEKARGSPAPAQLPESSAAKRRRADSESETESAAKTRRVTQFVAEEDAAAEAAAAAAASAAAPQEETADAD